MNKKWTKICFFSILICYKRKKCYIIRVYLLDGVAGTEFFDSGELYVGQLFECGINLYIQL